mgnify:CR=1 FL=1
MGQCLHDAICSYCMASYNRKVQKTSNGSQSVGMEEYQDILLKVDLVSIRNLIQLLIQNHLLLKQ